MPLSFRLATPADHAALRTLILDAFEPITWAVKADERFGPLNGLDWRDRWQMRLDDVLEHQIVLVGFLDGQLAACATGTVDRRQRLGYIDILAVVRGSQGQGLGREMLRGMIDTFRDLGCRYVHLDCMETNTAGNRLYESEGFVEMTRQIRWMKPIPEAEP